MLKKRLFFAFSVDAPWPPLPRGRIIDPTMRHMTAAFLGEVALESLIPLFDSMPKPPFKVGLAGQFSDCLFLPPRHPHVAAWKVGMGNHTAPLETYVYKLQAWLKSHGFHIENRDSWLPHVTIARAPFQEDEWNKAFQNLPMSFSKLHLYESLPELSYKPVATFEMLAPFEEIAHTADLAFIVKGENESDLLHNSFTALAFHFPALLPFGNSMQNNVPIVAALNQILAKADTLIGCPFKAVSYHGEIKEVEPGVLQWEMIVDV